MKRRIIRTDKAPEAIGPYSQGISLGDLVFCAGQIPLDPATGQLIEGDIVRQTRRVVENLASVLEAAGSGLDRVLRLDVYLTDISVFPEINAVLSTVFPEEPPARVTVQVSGLPMDAAIEMAAIGARQGAGEGEK